MQRNTRVRLLVSSGPEQVTVPDTVGLSRNSAEARMDDAGLGVSVEEEESEEPEGEVIAQSPAGGTHVDPGSRVTLTISKGPKQVAVPDVVGMPAAEAAARLRAAGLQVSQQRRDTVAAAEDGVVLDQRPGAGEDVDAGSTVVIVVGRLVAEEDPDDGAAPAPAAGGGDSLRVAVLGGGRSSEHDVSLASAEAVRAGLATAGHEAVDVRISGEGRWTLDGEPLSLDPGAGLVGADAVFPALHGPFGEDGTVQGLLELLDVPYVGAGVAASAVSMDKALFKDLMSAHGLPQGEYAVVRDGERPRLAFPPAGVRQAGSARLIGGDLEGQRLGRAGGVAEARLPARSGRGRRADDRRARGRVLGARQRAARGVAAGPDR